MILLLLSIILVAVILSVVMLSTGKVRVLGASAMFLIIVGMIAAVARYIAHTTGGDPFGVTFLMCCGYLIVWTAAALSAPTGK